MHWAISFYPESRFLWIIILIAMFLMHYQFVIKLFFLGSKRMSALFSSLSFVPFAKSSFLYELRLYGINARLLNVLRNIPFSDDELKTLPNREPDKHSENSHRHKE